MFSRHLESKITFVKIHIECQEIDRGLNGCIDRCADELMKS